VPGVSFSTAGGRAGPGLPSAYVGCSVNVMALVAGSGPSATGRSADSPGARLPPTAIQVIADAVSVIGAPWMLSSGVASFSGVICGAQSSTDSGNTSAIGVSAGSVSFTRVIGLVPVLVTVKCTFWPEPWTALGGSTVTSARAGPAVARTPAVAVAARRPARRAMRFRLTAGSSDLGGGWFNALPISLRW
jgi:hypothetical protein